MSHQQDDDDGVTTRWRRAAGGRWLTRRRVLTGSSAVVAGVVAGCGALSGGGSTDELQFSRLHRTAVFVADGVSLSLPDEVPTVDAPTNADLLVLPDDTDVGAAQAVDWLAAERVLAVLGESAESTWRGWVRSDEYDETFHRNGFSDSEPDPDLIVGAAVGLDVPTYRHSWTDGPRDRDILRAIDEDLTDIDAMTPR